MKLHYLDEVHSLTWIQKMCHLICLQIMSTIMIHTESKEYQTKNFIYTNTNPNPKCQVSPSHTQPHTPTKKELVRGQL